jgi:hypothetical protein
MSIDVDYIFPKICGILIETRKLENVHILIENFQTVMPARCLYFFCGNLNYEYYYNFYINEPFIIVKNLGVDELNFQEYNDLLKSMDFWNQFEYYTHVLTININGCLCENSNYKIEDFLKYDYVGGYTPNKLWWKETQGLHNYSDYQCFNGGFSFRRMKAIKKVLETFLPLPTKEFNTDLSFKEYTEDLYFVSGLLILNLRDFDKKYTIGLDNFATNFCTHTHFVNKSFCVYKYDKYIDDEKLKEFLNYCPIFINFISKNMK